MAAATEQKLFLGMRLKRLRRDLGLTQTRMAEDLALSPSYLNHLERNQRPLTAQVLLRLARTYDIDVRSLSGDGDASDARDLTEILADPLFKDLAIPRHELTEVAREAPGIADALARLYRAYGRDRAGGGADAGGARPGPAPAQWVGDYIQAQRNHFPELEDAAVSLAGALAAQPPALEEAARRRLAEVHGVQARAAPADLMAGMVRRYDHHRRRLLLSERLAAPSRAFALAYQLCAFEHGDLVDDLAGRVPAPGEAAQRLLKVALTNYLAAAVMMPYEPFRTLCEAGLYDLGLLAARFGASREQVCHRLTTLARPTARGVPFFMLRLDAAGNLSKRFAAGAYPFSRLGATCPRWNIHAAFRAPDALLTQVLETPQGERFFTLAMTVPRLAATGAGGGDLAVGLGCELKFAPRLIQARGLDLGAPSVTPIGPACRACERRGCVERAAEPASRALEVEESAKSVSAFPFVEPAEARFS